MTFNHWVTGSNPVALTIPHKRKPLKAFALGGLFLSSRQAIAKYNVKSRESSVIAQNMVYNVDYSIEIIKLISSIAMFFPQKNKVQMKKTAGWDFAMQHIN